MTKPYFMDQIRQWLKPDREWLSLVSPSGEKEFIFIGSIHMGVPDMAPLPAGLRKVLSECHSLVVEADITLTPPPEIDSSTHVPPLQPQLSSEQWKMFDAVCKECHFDATTLAQFPAWQIGLTLQQKQAYLLGLRPEFGIDHQLLTLAHHSDQPIIALESQQQQLNLLVSLPNNGIDLLLDSLAHWRSNARQLQKMIEWWLSKNQQRYLSLPELSRSFGNDLQHTFIIERNKKWASHLRALPAGRYLVAVGALHLSGPENLIDLLHSSYARESL